MPDVAVDRLRRMAALVVPSRRRKAEQWSRIAAVCDIRNVVVARGPFVGLRLGSVATGSDAPKALGSYELELHGVLEEAIERGYDVVIDVGAGEGYYALGLAARQPDAISVAFDTSPRAQSALTANAEINDLSERVVSAGHCSSMVLARLAAQATRPLVVIDCEGYEDELLCSGADVSDALGHALLIVETHEFARPGVTHRLVRRFTPTHRIQVLPVRSRIPSDYPELSSLRLEDQRRALEESRPPEQVWLVMRPRETPSISS